ncbi:hypothetical protein [Actinomycetospora sp. NBRC 106378]|uniref:hypothetical protein n=1 Tax=Actinomycetospora sp. NBRC 106378 TaxID=3032208 RepID=UPI0024A41309|nr:hypothetical protein [Actinomycetospora sp. NBRC 106378]GLZ52589.1 hypothetical protein Acsp07_22060 [Actinomycetospora sp. NBRC 106378]
MTELLRVNVMVLVVLGGFVCLAALPAFAMANADPASGPMLRNGLLQVPAYLAWWGWLYLGVREAYRALALTGGEALLAGALGWGIWVGGAAATMTVFAGLVRIDLRIARRRER